jgi:hypothetical protein
MKTSISGERDPCHHQQHDDEDDLTKLISIMAGLTFDDNTVH